MVLAGRILERISLNIFGDGKNSIHIKVSLAVASYPEDKKEKGMALVELADQLLSKAKEGGGNQVCSSVVSNKATGPIAKNSDIYCLKEKISKLTKRATQSLIETTFAFAKTVELKDQYPVEHVEMVVRYATQILQDMNLPNKVELIKEAAMLHDLGKVGISEIGRAHV